MTIIEFFGHPGAGKSTISHKLAQELRHSGQKVSEPSYTLVTDLHLIPSLLIRLTKMSNQIIKQPRQSYCSILNIWNSDQKSVNNLLRTTYYHLFTMAEYNRIDMNKNIHIFDQGLIQSVWSILLTGEVEVKLNQFIKNFPSIRSNWVVVVVNASEEVIRDRLRQRFFNTTRINVEEELKESLHHFRDMRDNLYSLEKSTDTFDLIEVNNNSRECIPSEVSKIKDVL